MTTISPIRKSDNWYTGEDQAFDWVIDDGAGTAVAIAGWGIEFRMAPTAGGASALTYSGTITGSSTVRISVIAADTVDMPPKKYQYSLSRIDSGFNQVLAGGDAWLQARVT